MRRTVLSLLVASLVVLAGCAGGITGQESTQAQSADSGTVQFYVSDERNAIDQFEHLNVTVTKIGFAQSGDADANSSASGEWSVESESESDLDVSVEGNVTAGENTTVTVTQDGEAVTKATVVVSAGESETTVRTDANGTATVPVPADVEQFSVDVKAGSDGQNSEGEASLEFEYETESGEDSGAGWVGRDVDNRTVDLTELQGANATLLGNVTVPAGEYEKVFVHVGEVEGTLKSGEQVNVKLPSQKLHLNEGFTVDSAGGVDFVFDITVFEAGNSGKYILKPVASESGTDVPIERVDDEGESEAEAELEANFVGDVRAGENATVKVTQDGDAVANATVELDGVTVTTDANGTATVQVPADAEEVELEVSTGEDSQYGEAEAELEADVGADSGDGESEESESTTENESSASASLAVNVEGTFAAGEEVVVFATDGDGDPVEGAEVYVDGELVGETNADGELAFTLPEDADMQTDVTVKANGTSVVVDSSTVAAAQ
ncbi:MAG: DUF4382 domain-containing protein [Halobacterium sp.]